MFKWLKNRAEARHGAKKLYLLVSNHSRNPVFYRDLFVSDSMTARYEILSIHLYLLLERLKHADQGSELSQNLTEVFVRELERAYREIGVRDLSVPKHIKKLIAGFYERCHAYQRAIESGSEKSLAPSITNYVYAQTDINHALVEQFSAYMMNTHKYLATLPIEEIRAANFSFPSPLTLITNPNSNNQHDRRTNKSNSD